MSDKNLAYNWPGDNLLVPLVPTVVVGTPDPQYGVVANLVNGQPYLPYKATTTSLTLQWDMGTNRAPVWVQVTHGNLDGTASWKTNAAADFSGAGETYALTLTPQDPDGYYDDVYRITPTATARRYHRLEITGNSQPVILGELWCSATARYLTHDPQKGVERPEQRVAVVNHTVAGIDLSYDLGVREDALRTVTIVTSRVVGEALLRKWDQAAHGRLRIFVLADRLTGRAMLVRHNPGGSWRPANNDAEYSSKSQAPNIVTVNLNFKAVSRGLAWVNT